MRLATIRVDGATRAVRVDADGAVELGADDLVDLLRLPDWRERAASAHGTRHDLSELDYAPVVLAPEKIVCVGLNYRNHITEMGRELPAFPTLFAKFASALVGAYDEIVLPAESNAMDWEAELAVIIGSPIRHASVAEADAAIAGFTVINDVTARDWQYRTGQWLQGKTFEASTPIGPWLLTSDQAPAESTLTCAVDGELVQQAHTAELVFSPAALVAYISQIFTLSPGDVIATGTPGGVGHARTPPRYLQDGSVLTTALHGIGECRNVCRRPSS